MKELLKRVIDHDFYYQMSDSPRTYERGLDTERALKTEVDKHELHAMLMYLEELKHHIIKLKNN